MPRITPIDPASATGKAAELYAGPLAGKHLNIFKSMIASPASVEFYLSANAALGGGVLSAAEREAIQLAISEQNACDYCNGAHTMMGKGAGLTTEQTIAARQGTPTGDARLDALVRFAHALHTRKGFVEDADIAAFRGAGLGDDALVEVIAVYALITFTNYFNHVNQTVLDVPAAPALQTA